MTKIVICKQSCAHKWLQRINVDKTSKVEQNQTLANEESQELPVPRFNIMTGVLGVSSYLLGSIPAVIAIFIIGQIRLEEELATNPDAVLSDVILDISKNPWASVAILVSQSIAFMITLILISRFRGSKNWRRDMGFKFSRWSPFYFFLGFLLQGIGILLSSVFLILKDGDTPQQEIVQTVKESTGLGLIVLMLLIALVVPIVEEIAFRGLLQRSVATRFTPLVAVLTSSIIFAVIHFQDVNVIIGATQLLMVGVVCGILAMYRGRLDAAIFTHMGFNSATVLLLLIVS